MGKKLRYRIEAKSKNGAKIFWDGMGWSPFARKAEIYEGFTKLPSFVDNPGGVGECYLSASVPFTKCEHPGYADREGALLCDIVKVGV